MTRPKTEVVFRQRAESTGAPWRVFVDGTEREPGSSLGELVSWLRAIGVNREKARSEIHEGDVVYRVRFRLPDDQVEEFDARWCRHLDRVEPDPGPRDAGCTGKVAHDDQAGALAHAQRLLTSPKYVRPEGRLLRAYECRRCGRWHVGHEVWRDYDRTGTRT